MKKIIRHILLVNVCLLLMSARCSQEKETQVKIQKQLFEQYREGEIAECIYKGSRVFTAGLNAPDAGTEIYDENGKKIGACYYSTRQVDAICNELSSCEVIYRCEGHITGQPPVDKYGLLK